MRRRHIIGHVLRIKPKIVKCASLIQSTLHIIKLHGAEEAKSSSWSSWWFYRIIEHLSFGIFIVSSVQIFNGLTFFLSKYIKVSAGKDRQLTPSFPLKDVTVVRHEQGEWNSNIQRLVLHSHFAYKDPLHFLLETIGHEVPAFFGKV